MDQIHLDSPKYLEAVVTADVIPSDPERADDVKFAVGRQLQAFLHPLSGGPAKQGWEPGRDVYISEIAAEIENVPGVDYVANLQLQASGRQQACLQLAEPEWTDVEFPVGSIVSTFDDRSRMTLGRVWREGSEVTELLVHGFQGGGLVKVIATDGLVYASGLEAANVTVLSENPLWHVVTFADPIAKPAQWSEPVTDLELQDGRVCLPIQLCCFDYDDEGNTRMTGAGVQAFTAGEFVSVTHWKHLRRRKDLMIIEAVQRFLGEDRIFVPDDHLVCSGEHSIKMKLEGHHANSTA